MYFLLSGEGPSDLGVCQDGEDRCEGAGLRSGPMALFVDRIVHAQHGYSLIEAGCYGFISERGLAVRAEDLKAARKSLQLPGKKRAKETRYFFNNARILARVAGEVAGIREDVVVAVLFRDSDGTASAGRGLWETKRQSMLDGFLEEGFSRGVPMIPKPKSEAWLLCALQPRPYQNCTAMEDRSGNDHSPNSLKRELSGLLDQSLPVVEGLCQMIEEGKIDVDRIEMPSFRAFRSRLEEAIS